MALTLCLLGQLRVLRDGEVVELPPSKKTRALLAYLVLTGRSHRRDRLVDLLWDVTDDPRGALRWALSRLRKAVDEPGAQRITADRQEVRFDPVDVDVDVRTVRAALSQGPQALTTEALEALATQLEPDLLEGLSLEDFDAFQSWYLAEREAMVEVRGTVLRELAARHVGNPEARLVPLRRLVQDHPLDEDVRAELIRTLAALSRFTEARQQVQAGRRVRSEVGRRPSGRLRAALDAEEAPPSEPVPTPAPVTAPAAPTAMPLVGRAQELQTILGWLAVPQRPVVLLIGEAGIGKTRLVDAVAAAHRGLVLRAVAYEAERRPWGTWRDAFASANLDELTALLDGASSSRDAVIDGVGRTLAERSDALVVLDDVQWCDPDSAELLHAVQRQAPGTALLLAARRGEVDGHPALLRVLRAIRRRGALRELVLGPLAPDDVAALVAHHHPDRPTDDVVEQAGGNPLFALELAHRDPGGTLPSSLSSLVRDRLATLSPDASSALRWAAVFGAPIGTETLAELLVVDGPGALLEAVEELERHEVLVSSGEGVLRFGHELVQRVVYDELSVARRRLMHGRVAEVLGKRRSNDAVTDLVRHAAMAGDSRTAAEACVRAGWASQRLHATTEAASLARRGLRFAEQLDEPEATELALQLHELALASGRPDEPERVAGRLVRLAERALDHGSAEHARLGFHLAAWVRWEEGDFSDAHRQAMRAEFVSRQGASHALAQAEAARLLWRLERDLPQAEAMLLHASAEARQQGVEVPALSLAWGLLYLHRGFLDQAEVAFGEARDLARAHSDGVAELEALDHETMLAVRLGQLDKAIELADALVALAAKVRGGTDETYAKAVRQVVGWMRAAEPDDPAAALLAVAGRDPRQRRGPLLCRAAAHALTVGNRERARAWATLALDEGRGLNRPSIEAFAACVLAELGEELGLESVREFGASRRRMLSREVQARLLGVADQGVS